jgi:hypothetical protein
MKPNKTKTGWQITVTFDRKQARLTLGPVSRAAASSFCAQLGLLCEFKKHGETIKPDLIEWIQGLATKHKKQLGKIGLISERDDSLTIKGLINLFLKDYDQREDIADSTKKRMDRTLRRYPARFTSLPVKMIEPQRDDSKPNSAPMYSLEAKRHLIAATSYMREHYSPATWSRTNGNLRECGAWAVLVGLCHYNPFKPLSKHDSAILPCPKKLQINDTRNVHVKAEWVRDAMEMTDWETRVLFALGRFGGLRIPSEARTLKWAHIEETTIQVRDSKTKGVIRPLPLFEDIRVVLHEKPKRERKGFVLSSETLTSSDMAIYKRMLLAVQRTEWEPWERLRQNLRASCENDLLEKFPEHLVVQWIGHSVSTSRAHYQKPKPEVALEAIGKVSF